MARLVRYYNTKNFVLDERDTLCRYCSYCGQKLERITEYDESSVAGLYWHCDCRAAEAEKLLQEKILEMEERVEELKRKHEVEFPVNREMMNKMIYDRELDRLKSKYKQSR